MTASADNPRHGLLETLAGWPLFAGMQGPALAALVESLALLVVHGGEMLFDQDEEADAVYLLLHGRMAALRQDADGRRRSLGTMAPGECVGEIGLIAGEIRPTRFARVVALRDCELARLGRADFERLMAAWPQAMLGMARLALRRFYGTRGRPEAVHCVAVLPAAQGVDAVGFAHRLSATLAATASTELLDAGLAAGQPTSWFSEREAAVDHLVYVGNEDRDWRTRCIRQSDVVLLLVDGDRAPEDDPPRPPERISEEIPHHLVLVRAQAPRAGVCAAWRRVYPHVTAHHHVRHDEDLCSLVRRLTGRARGLVLSGGGARGFAHLGVIRALREAGMDIDHVGGNSIGAIVGAGLAADWSDARMLETYREHFVLSNPLGDWTLPLVALRSGRRVSRRLRAAFGELDIDDLPRPFFCVSSDLTAGMLHVHEDGPLWPALRASSAIPGVLPPVLSGGRVLVDGGVIDNLPVQAMGARLSGDIVAVDVGGSYRLDTDIEETELPPWWRLLGELFATRRRPGLKQILLRAGMVNSEATTQRRQKQTTLLIKPALDDVELLDWRAYDRVIELGYVHACRALEAAAGKSP
ncbi:MAG: patatin-like phospholipase family protein [Lysobacteraceae bacterium]